MVVTHRHHTFKGDTSGHQKHPRFKHGTIVFLFFVYIYIHICVYIYVYMSFHCHLFVLVQLICSNSLVFQPYKAVPCMRVSMADAFFDTFFQNLLSQFLSFHTHMCQLLPLDACVCPFDYFKTYCFSSYFIFFVVVVPQRFFFLPLSTFVLQFLWRLLHLKRHYFC